MQSPYLLSFHRSARLVFVMICWYGCLSHRLDRQRLLPYLLSFRRKGQTYPAWLANRKYQSNLLGPTSISVCAFTSTEPCTYLLPPYSHSSLHYQKRQLSLLPVVMGPHQITLAMFKKSQVKQTHMLQRWSTAFVKHQKGACLEVKVNVHFHSEISEGPKER